MATKVVFVQRSIEWPGHCAMSCVVNRCPCTVPVTDWLNSLLVTYSKAEVLDFRFQIDPDPEKHCIHAIAQVRYNV